MVPCTHLDQTIIYVIDDGAVFTFGSDYYGCLGCEGEEGEEVSTPVLVTRLSGHHVTQLACGDAHVLALTREGQVYSWGCGEFGECMN